MWYNACMKNVLTKIGIALVAVIVIALLLVANFASDALVERVDEAYKEAVFQKKVVKSAALGVVRWWIGGRR